MNTFELKTRVCFGEDSLGALAEIEAENAVIFTDAFMKKSGNADKIASYMKGCRNISVFSETIPDPPIELIVKALEFLLDANTDVWSPSAAARPSTQPSPPS